MYLERLQSAGLHSNGLLNQELGTPSSLVLAWRGILQNVRGARQRAPWPHCCHPVSTEAFFPKTWQLFLLGQSEFVPQLEFWLPVLIWVLKNKFLPRSPVFNIHTWYSYLSTEINIDYLFFTASAGMAPCLIPSRPGQLWRAAVSVHRVLRNGCAEWGRKWAWKEKSYGKLLFLALAPISGSWLHLSADPGLCCRSQAL